MKITKRSKSEIIKEDAHGGSGSRKVYASNNHLKSAYFEMMTHGFLSAKKEFDWHKHENVEEVMVVLKGSGNVFDKDGVYSYSIGDVFIFPSNIMHKIVNTGEDESEMIFVRVTK
jgi:mannose-6-phosphate isomerase-like protein (cupin superfamily)